MRFTASRLTVSETRGHPTFENGLHQRFSSVLVDDLVVASFIERVIESKDLVLQVFG